MSAETTELREAAEGLLRAIREASAAAVNVAPSGPGDVSDGPHHYEIPVSLYLDVAAKATMLQSTLAARPTGTERDP